MAKTKFILEADQAKAVGAFLKVVEAQDKTTRGMRKMNREGAKTNKTMVGIGRSVAGWLGGFASIAGVVRGLQAINAEMKKAQGLRKEMYQAALSMEQLTSKIAYLREDVSISGLEAVKKDIAEISRQTAASTEVVSKALFFSESVMKPGGIAAKSAATVIAQYAAPAGLTPEETALIPAIFKITGATTRKKQMQIVNQLAAATRASIAEPGEFMKPFIEPLTMGMQRGFTFAQLLAQMTAGILTAGGVEKGGTATRAAIEIASGKTKKALEFFYKEGKERDIDFGALKGAERYKFVSELYQEYEAKGPKALDIFVTTVGGKGVKYLGAMFGKTGREQYAEVLPGIKAAKTSADVEEMARQYKETLSAKAVGMERREQMAETKVAMEYKANIAYQDIIGTGEEGGKGIFGKVIGMEVGFGDYMRGVITTDKMQKARIGRMMIQENLALALEQKRGTPEETEIKMLMSEFGRIEVPSFHPEFLKRAYKATGGFTMPEKLGRFAEFETIQEFFRLSAPGIYGGDREVQPGFARKPYYMRGLEAYYDVDLETIQKNIESQDRNTESNNRLTESNNRLADKLEQGIGVGGLNAGPED